MGVLPTWLPSGRDTGSQRPRQCSLRGARPDSHGQWRQCVGGGPVVGGAGRVPARREAIHRVPGTGHRQPMNVRVGAGVWQCSNRHFRARSSRTFNFPIRISLNPRLSLIGSTNSQVWEWDLQMVAWTGLGIFWVPRVTLGNPRKDMALATLGSLLAVSGGWLKSTLR
jgi:hypothetical protein